MMMEERDEDTLGKAISRVSAALLLAEACSETLMVQSEIHPEITSADVVNGVMTLMRRTINTVLSNCDPSVREHNREQFKQGLMQLMMETLDGGKIHG